MIKIRNHWGYEPLPEDTEKTKGVSMTVPNQSLSINEILTRFTHGVAPNITIEGYYSDTQNFEDTEPVINDLTDIDDIKQEIIFLNKQLEELEKKEVSEKTNEAPDITT